MDNLATIIIFTDGGSRGNPGEASLGVFIQTEEGKELVSIGKRLGIATNNVAEYSAIKEGLVWVQNNINQLRSLKKIIFYMDSNLAVNQLNGLYKIKNPNLRIIFFEIKSLEVQLKIPIYYNHIPREKNKKADKLVNMALDGKL